MPPSRHDLKLEFLEKTSLGHYQLTEMPADASFRTYSRIETNSGSFVLMNCPPSYCSIDPFIKVTSILRTNDILAPEIFAADKENGFLLLEDFGDVRVKDLLKNEHYNDYKIYTRVLDILGKIQSIKTDELELHTDDLLLEGINTFTDWYLPITIGRDDAKLAEHKAAVIEIWQDILHKNDIAREVVALRDFHVENLMMLEDGRIGVLDFQDARLSHPAYDLVSLLEDARYDVTHDLSKALFEEYYVNNDCDEDFLEAYRILGMQRNLRILGMCARKYLRDNDDRYLALIPRVLGYVNIGLAYPELTRLEQFVPKYEALND